MYFYILVINVTLPDEKQNYVHRIGRVGRAERYILSAVSKGSFDSVKGTQTIYFSSSFYVINQQPVIP